MCLKLEPLDFNRYQIQYPLTRANKRYRLTGNKPFEMGYILVDLVESDSATFSFTEKFSGVPNVMAGLLTVDNGVGNVNVYTTAVSPTGGTLKTSAPITATVVVQAVYFEP